MSIIGYDSFVRAMEERFREIMTAAVMDDALDAVRETLAGYEITQVINEDGEYRENDDFMLDAYLDAMRVEGRSPKTVERYRYVISRMLNTIHTRSGHITTYHLREYMASEKRRGISDSTLRGYREIFNAYFGWLQREELIRGNPVQNISPIKCQKKMRMAFSATEIEKLKRSCGTRRDLAIVCFLLATGCRVSEMTGLNLDRVNLERMECTVLGKGNKERTVYLDEVAVLALREYLDRRKDNDKALFLGKRKERLQPNGVRCMLCELGKKAGVENVHPHKFRRTCATNLIRHGMPIQEVAAILGHEKIDTTMKYIVLDQAVVKGNYLKFA